MNENVDAALIAEALNRHKVDYVIIGGYAAELHEVAGLPPTRDIDVCPSTELSNLERLSSALADLHALIRTESVDGGLPFSHDAESLAKAAMWNLVCDGGELDITFEPAGGGYAYLKPNAVIIELVGQRICVAAIDDVIASKTAAGRPKDLSALPSLIRHQRRGREHDIDQPGGD
jgi:hypothetical protein